MIMKRICITITLFCTLITLCACKQTKDSSAVATINGESITADELDYFTGKLKAQVLNDYLQEYSVKYTPDFWSREFDGKTPEQALKEQALEKCFLAKLQFVMMREKGIYSDISYKGLFEKATAFNKENIDKESVVGLKTIKMSQFYTYYLDNGAMELRNILAESKFKPTEDEINERAMLLTASSRDFGGNDLKSIGKSELIEEKYDKYITDLRDSADVKILEGTSE